MKNYNFQNKNIPAVNKKQDRVLDAVVYIIMIVTMVMLCPLIYRLANTYSNSNISVSNDKKDDSSDRISKNRKYIIKENQMDMSVLKNTEFGDLSLIKAKVTNDGKNILFCGSQVVSEETGKTSNVLRIAVVEGINKTDFAESSDDINHYSDISIYQRAVMSGFYKSVLDNDFVYKDYSDGTIFLSNNKSALLFDIENLKIVNSYTFPQNYNIYQAALSNKKDKFAIAADEGFFICSSDTLNSSNSSMSSNIISSQMKELISSYVNANGVKISARYPVWSSSDDYIYYKMCADNYVKNAGMTTAAPGGNELLSSLDSTNFLFLNDDSIFYYFSSSSETSPENLFRCGYFNVIEKKMVDVMKSQVYYFDINVSSNGTHLAALSHNGSMVKINIIDIRTKKLIYSTLYDDIYDFSFSPNEKNVIIYGKKDGKTALTVIEIDWIEE